MQSNIAVAKKMVAYLKANDLTVPKLSTTSPVWGRGKKQAAWRVSGHAFGSYRAATQKTQYLCDLLFLLTPAQTLRRAIIAGYHSILGAKEGGSVQKAIAAFCHISAREPWCAETAWYVLKKLAGYNGPAPVNIAYVPSWEAFAQSHGILIARRNARPGMYVTFCWDGKRAVGGGDHIGILHKTGIVRHTIRANPITDEGNASGPGGVDAVVETTRYWWQVNCVMDPAKLQK